MSVTTCSPPQMQLVCQLVALGTLSNVTSSDVCPLPTMLPSGFEAYPETAAYKVHYGNMRWAHGKNLCEQKGARLAAIDSWQKLGTLKTMFPTSGTTHTGIIRVQDDWININTGFAVPSIPWKSGHPSGTAGCAVFNSEWDGLANEDCNSEHNYICEFPILLNDTVAYRE